jgi:hypothetical protein
VIAKLPNALSSITDFVKVLLLAAKKQMQSNTALLLQNGPFT